MGFFQAFSEPFGLLPLTDWLCSLWCIPKWLLLMSANGRMLSHVPYAVSWPRTTGLVSTSFCTWAGHTSPDSLLQSPFTHFLWEVLKSIYLLTFHYHSIHPCYDKSWEYSVSYTATPLASDILLLPFVLNLSSIKKPEGPIAQTFR